MSEKETTPEELRMDNEYLDVYRNGQFLFSFSFTKTIPDEEQRILAERFLKGISNSELARKEGEEHARKLNLKHSLEIYGLEVSYKKQFEERIRETIERLRETLLNGPIDAPYDYGLKTAIGIIQTYIPEKGEKQ